MEALAKKGEVARRGFRPALEAAAHRLGQRGFEGAVQFTILGDEGKAESWTASASKGKGALRASPAKPAGGPRVEVLLRREDAALVLEGTISPLDAMARGGLRIRGDIQAAVQAYKRLAAPGSVMDPHQWRR